MFLLRVCKATPVTTKCKWLVYVSLRSLSQYSHALPALRSVTSIVNGVTSAQLDLLSDSLLYVSFDQANFLLD